MAHTPIDILQVALRLRPDVNYDPSAYKENAWIEALVDAVNGQSLANYNAAVAAGGMALVASVDQDITISGDVLTSDTPLWTSTGGTLLIVSAIRLLTATTAGTFTPSVTYTENGAVTNPNVGTLNIATAVPNNARHDVFVYSDSGSTFGWNYEVTGFSGSNASVRLSIKAYLAA